VKLFKTVKVSLTGVVDTGEELFTVSMTPAKHRNNRISPRIFKKIEIVTRLVYWGQEKLFEEKNQR
jgi:hypothetical protein